MPCHFCEAMMEKIKNRQFGMHWDALNETMVQTESTIHEIFSQSVDVKIFFANFCFLKLTMYSSF